MVVVERQHRQLVATARRDDEGYIDDDSTGETLLLTMRSRSSVADRKQRSLLMRTGSREDARTLPARTCPVHFGGRMEAVRRDIPETT